MTSRNASLSEKEVDDLVIAEADLDEAWELPVTVKPAKATSYSLPEDLTSRASFLARVHHRPNVEEWLRQVIRERIELEETAFTEAKRELSAGARTRPSSAPSRAPRS